MRPPPMVSPLSLEEVMEDRKSRLERNAGENVRGLQYAPQYANARPVVVDPPQYSEEEISRARFRQAEGLEGDPIDKQRIVQQKLQVATERDKKLRLLRERGLL